MKLQGLATNRDVQPCGRSRETGRRWISINEADSQPKEACCMRDYDIRDELLVDFEVPAWSSMWVTRSPVSSVVASRGIHDIANVRPKDSSGDPLAYLSDAFHSPVREQDL